MAGVMPAGQCCAVSFPLREGHCIGTLPQNKTATHKVKIKSLRATVQFVAIRCATKAKSATLGHD